MGKETIRAQNVSVSHGKSGGYSDSFNKTGRELLTPDELSIMDNNNCVLFIRGENPFFCTKYPLEKHPAYSLSGDANDKYLFDVRELVNTGEKRRIKKKDRVRKPHHVIKDLENADGRESTRQMKLNARRSPRTSIRGQELGVTKPLKEGVEELVRVSPQAEVLRQQEEDYLRYQREGGLVVEQEFDINTPDFEQPLEFTVPPMDYSEPAFDTTFEFPNPVLDYPEPPPMPPEPDNAALIENMIAFEGGSPIPTGAEVMFEMYGDNDFDANFDIDIESSF